MPAVAPARAVWEGLRDKRYAHLCSQLLLAEGRKARLEGAMKRNPKHRSRFEQQLIKADRDIQRYKSLLSRMHY